MITIKNENKENFINPELLPKSLRKYYWLIEGFEKSYEYEGDNDWWCYLLPQYETDYNTITIHDSLKYIRMELKDLAIKYKEFAPKN